MNGLIIYAIVGAAIIFVILAFSIGRYSIDSRKVGKCHYHLDRESQHMNTSMLILRVVVGLAILILYMIVRGTEFSWLSCAFVAVMSFMLGSFASPLFIRDTDLGIYEHGVITQYGVALYDQCSGYTLNANATRGVQMLILYNKIPLLRNYMIVVPPNDVAKVKNLVSRKLVSR